MIDVDALTVRPLVVSDRELLEELATREAVVPIRGPGDLARRLASDRRVLVVLHPDGSPLVFVHVALSDLHPTTLRAALHGATTTGEPRVATCYGITRVDDRARGHAGTLLHAAVRFLLKKNQSLKSVVTLSPMPGFRAWVERNLGLLQGQSSSVELEALARTSAAGLATSSQRKALESLARFWLAAQDDRGRLQDPVARFHLGNGASIRSILVGADGSWSGLEESFGVMVSYQYVPVAAVALPAWRPQATG